MQRHMLDKCDRREVIKIRDSMGRIMNLHNMECNDSILSLVTYTPPG